LLNGRSPLYGIAEQTLKNGDKVIFFYTDDFTQETGSEQWHSGSSTTAQTTETKNEAGADTQATAKSFKDISAHWGKASIEFIASQGLMKGVSDTEFAPNALMTRGMTVTVLYRLAKEPKGGAAAFDDVKSGKWYYDAVAWAASQGIAAGVSKEEFAPETNVTREQLAVMLYRYAEKTGKDVAGQADLKAFKDGAAVSDYAKAALSFAVYKGLINGRTDGALDPQGKATRAEVAAILERFIKAYSG
ncbi:MAG: S-layer homology domain-containing protein, partial [Clostridia bacterium]|nr:S-layer homology domain-containing protein [Clostridia bacterium]